VESRVVYSESTKSFDIQNPETFMEKPKIKNQKRFWNRLAQILWKITYYFKSYGLILWELLARKTVESHLKEQDERNKKENKKEVLPKDRHLLFSAETTLPPSVATYPLVSILTTCLQGTQGEGEGKKGRRRGRTYLSKLYL
jgi:hypothetical protein